MTYIQVTPDYVATNSLKVFQEMNEHWKQVNPVTVSAFNDPVPYPVKKAGQAPCKKEEKGNKMDTYYINDRLYETFYKKEHDARATFHLDNDPAPQTAAELVKRIQDGKFVLPSEKDDYSPRCIVWRDPAVTADKEGFKAYQKALNEAHQKAKDIVNIVSDEQARLKALQDFEAWTPTGAAN